MTASVPFQRADGQHLTLDDLADFVAVALGAGLPGSTPVRVMGAIDPVSLAGLWNHGPRVTSIVPDPAGVPT